jgi:hypothetical protein
LLCLAVLISMSRKWIQICTTDWITINLSLYTNTYTTDRTVLSVKSSSIGIMVKIIQNIGLKDRVNYAFYV